MKKLQTILITLFLSLTGITLTTNAMQGQNPGEMPDVEPRRGILGWIMLPAAGQNDNANDFSSDDESDEFQDALADEAEAEEEAIRRTGRMRRTFAEIYWYVYRKIFRPTTEPEIKIDLDLED